MRFAYQMAVRLGRVNVDAMLRSITAKQFAGWVAYARMEPFNELRADYRAASVVAMIANVNRGKGQKAVQLEDVMLKFGDEKPESKPARSPEDMERMMRMMFGIPPEA